MMLFKNLKPTSRPLTTSRLEFPPMKESINEDFPRNFRTTVRKIESRARPHFLHCPKCTLMKINSRFSIAFKARKSIMPKGQSSSSHQSHQVAKSLPNKSFSSSKGNLNLDPSSTNQRTNHYTRILLKN